MSSTYPLIKGALLSSEKYTWNTADTLGRGASGAVHLGRCKSSGTVVAVKVFHDHVAQCHKEDDLRELEILRQLVHPNIIELLDIEKEMIKMKIVLIMEYCEGGSLQHMLDQAIYFYGLPEDEYLLVLTHVAAGMKYLREKNVIHRDIKPGNIMRFITEDGFSIYKLTDFGAARSLDEDESFQSLYGTEEYLHPGIYERAVLKLPSRQSFDAKVDLWSLGVTFYHTATGQLPFQPYGGRQNRQKMFEIITQKESGVISGVQNFADGPILWKRTLPGTCPLSSGLKPIVISLLSGLMEPDVSKMITYDSFFRMVANVKQKVVIDIFHYSRCEDLKVYADPSTKLSGLQDIIASLTDIVASEQILLVGGQCLEEVVDSMCTLENYPPHLMHDSIYLFQKNMSEPGRIYRPDLPAFPEFPVHYDMDSEARLSHHCAARSELVKRFAESVGQQQQRIMDGLFCFRVYVENRLVSTKLSHNFMKQLMDECQIHFHTFFSMVSLLKNSLGREHKDVGALEKIVKDNVIRQVHGKASDRIKEIEEYRDMLLKKLDDVKDSASKVTTECREKKCLVKVNHHVSVISGIQSRFRRDKSVKNQMTTHDKNIHGFERDKLRKHCNALISIFTEHCLGQLEQEFLNALSVCNSLTKCLSRVLKIEKNISSVLSCQKLLSEKLIKLRTSVQFDPRSIKESGYESSESSQSTEKLVHRHAEHFVGGEYVFVQPQSSGKSSSVGAISADQAQGLGEKLQDLKIILDINSDLIRNLDVTSLESSGFPNHSMEVGYPTKLDGGAYGISTLAEGTGSQILTGTYDAGTGQSPPVLRVASPGATPIEESGHFMSPTMEGS